MFAFVGYTDCSLGWLLTSSPRLVKRPAEIVLRTATTGVFCSMQQSASTFFQGIQSDIKKEHNAQGNTHSVLHGGGASILDVTGGVMSPGPAATIAGETPGGPRSINSGSPGQRMPHPDTLPLIAGDGQDWHAQQTNRSPAQRCGAVCHRQLSSLLAVPANWVFLVLLGTLAAVVGFVFDSCSRALIIWRWTLTSPASGTGFVVWVAWCLVFGLLALAAVTLGSRRAEGSGVPQIKSILADTPLASYLRLKVLVPKAIGSLAAHVSGLSVGKEGPFVHITCILARHLWRLPLFGAIQRNPGLQRQMLAAAVAAGVTAVFGTPVGAVLFSMEVTATYYMVSNLWRAFVAAVVCVFALEIINAIRDDELFDATTITPSDVSSEIIAFALLGLLCGVAASAFVYLSSKVQIVRRATGKTARARAFQVALVCLLVAVCTYPAGFLRMSDSAAINSLFASSRAVDGPEITAGADVAAGSVPSDMRWALNEWTVDMPMPFAVAIYFVVKSVTTVVSIALPIPCGLFTPVFAMGASLGRLFGEIVASIVPSVAIEPAAYAVVGAAALTSGATHTLSTAVIVFELTKQIHHMVPVLVGVLIAYSVSSMFTLSVYDMLMLMSGLPFLPRALQPSAYRAAVSQMMQPVRSRGCPVLTADASLADVQHVLNLLEQGARRRASTVTTPAFAGGRDRAESGALYARLDGSVDERGGDTVEAAGGSSSQGAAEGSGDAAPPAQWWRCLRARAWCAGLDQDDAAFLSSSREVPVVASYDDPVLLGTVHESALRHVLLVAKAAQRAAPAGKQQGPPNNEHEDSFIGESTGVAGAAAPSGWETRRVAFQSADHGAMPGSADRVSDTPADGDGAVLAMNSAPFMVASGMSVSHVHFLFATCMLTSACVTHQGRLVGTVHREDFAPKGQGVAN